MPRLSDPVVTISERAIEIIRIVQSSNQAVIDASKANQTRVTAFLIQQNTKLEEAIDQLHLL